jgi:hypothetical protein
VQRFHVDNITSAKSAYTHQRCIDMPSQLGLGQPGPQPRLAQQHATRGLAHAAA